MAERLGVYTRYHQHEVTHAAIHLADLATNSGIAVTMRARDVCLREVTPHWDARVIQGDPRDFWEWANGCNRVLWTKPPPRIHITMAREAGIQSWILVVWEELTPDDIPTLLDADRVISPYACVSNALLTQSTASTTLMSRIDMPWDVLVPHSPYFSRGQDHRTVAFPLFDSQPQRNDGTVFYLIHDMLEACPDVVAKIGVGRGWSQAARRALRALQKQHGERITTVIRPRYLQRVAFFATADLTVWPSKYESLATIGLFSLSVGTPLLAWDIEPQAEYINHRHNGILVACELTENWLGVRQAEPNYTLFRDELITLLHDEPLLTTIQQSALFGLAERRERFHQGWRNLLQ